MANLPCNLFGTSGVTLNEYTPIGGVAVLQDMSVL